MKIALLGDIALFGKFSINENPLLKEYFKDVADLLNTYDMAIGNLETPFSVVKKSYGSKSAYISSDIENIELLKYLNIRYVNLANNHIFDYGSEGYLLTKKLLDEHKINYFGSEGLEQFVEFDDNKIALSGFCCYSTNPLRVVNDDSVGVNELNVERVGELINRNNAKGYYNIVSIHAGQEHVNYPNHDNVLLAHHLAKICPFTYYGHHPHVAQGVEYIKNSVIAYSLGNFCFDDVPTMDGKDILVKLSENNKSSFILELVLENNNVISTDIIPIYMAPNKMIIGEGTTIDQIAKFTNAIQSMNSQEYISMRHSLLNNYIEERKKKRDLNWYIKRLRPRYIKIILAARSNSKKYQLNVKKFL